MELARVFPFFYAVVIMDDKPKVPKLGPLSNLIFMSRSLQLRLYPGLILALGVYVYQFFSMQRRIWQMQNG